MATEDELKKKRHDAGVKAAETRRLNKIAAEEKRKQQEQEQKKKNSFLRNWNWLWLLLLLAAIVGLIIWNPLGIQIPHLAAFVSPTAAPTEPPALVSTETPAAPAEAATALWTPATCSSISTDMGIPLEVLIEGDGFVACVYDGPIVKINVPHFTVVDADRGAIEVWVNSDQVVSLEAGSMTFRQWNGKIDSACAQVLSLDEYLQTLDQNLHATAGNFTCP